MLTEDPEHLKAGSILRGVAADAHQEAGDSTFADYLRSPYPLAVERGKILRASLKLHRLLSTLNRRHPSYLTTVPQDEAGANRRNDPLNEEAAKELEKLGRDHEASILRSPHPTRYKNGLVRGAYDSYAWPGGNQLIYHTADGGVLCGDCRNGHNGSESLYADPSDRQWHVDGVSIYDEGPTMHCDHCNAPLEATYGDPDEPEPEEDQ
jgi:hypothetical protein